MPEGGDALRRIQNAEKYGRIIPTQHARERMELRGVSARDVRSAIRSATSAVEEEPGKYRLEDGRDVDGEVLRLVVCENQPGLLLVTVF